MEQTTRKEALGHIALNMIVSTACSAFLFSLAFGLDLVHGVLLGVGLFALVSAIANAVMYILER